LDYFENYSHLFYFYIVQSLYQNDAASFKYEKLRKKLNDLLLSNRLNRINHGNKSIITLSFLLHILHLILNTAYFILKVVFEPLQFFFELF